MRHDADLMAEGYNWYVDWSSSLNLIFMLVAVCGYLCIPLDRLVGRAGERIRRL